MDIIRNKTVILHSSIILLSLWMFNKKNIRLNIFLSIFIAYLAINFFDKKIKFKEQKEKELVEEKEKYIIPENSTKDDAVTNFLFSVQNYHEYNPLAYEEMVDSINRLYSIKDHIKKSPDNVFQLWDLAEKNKLNALNALHSITLSLRSDKNLVVKLDKKTLELESILNDNLLEIHDVYRNQLLKGYNRNVKHIDLGPKPHNYSQSKLYSYEFY